MKKFFAFLFALLILPVAFGQVNKQTPGTAIREQAIFEDDFETDDNWTIDNHSGSPHQWIIQDNTAGISAPSGYEGEEPVWSTITSDLINLYGYENPRLFVNHNLLHDTQHESYSARIEVRIAYNSWITVKVFEGSQQEKSTSSYFEYDISEILSGVTSTRIRFVFNSGADRDINWIINNTGIMASAIPGVPNPVISTNPVNGSNIQGISNVAWTKDLSGPKADGFRVYIDQEYPPQTMVFDDYAYRYYHTFEANKDYYWKVVPYNSYGDAENVEILHFSTYILEPFYATDFSDWTSEDLSGSDFQWEVISAGARVYSPVEEHDPAMWSSFTSPVIDCTIHERIQLLLSSTIEHKEDFDNYQAKIQLSTDGQNWQDIFEIEGDLDCNGFPASVYPLIDIMELADEQPHIQIRLVFNSNGDKDIEWRAFNVELNSLREIPENAVLVSPENNAVEQPIDITLSWDRGEGGIPAAYRIYMDENNPPQTLLEEDSISSILVENLEPATTYYWKVVPFNAAGEPEIVDVWSFSTTADPLAVPQFESAIKVFPNPATQNLNIVADETILEIKIFDILGQMVYSSNINQGSAIISVGALTKGVYLVQIETLNGLLSQRIKISR